MMNNLLKKLVPVGFTLLCFTVAAQENNVPTKDKDHDTQKMPSHNVEIDKKEMDKKIEEALKNFSYEPSLKELKRAALIMADADPESVKKWMSHTRWSAVLPDLKLIANRDLGRDESLDRYQDDPDKWGANTDKDVGLQISAQWNLAHLVYNPDQMRVYSALANRADRREALLTLLVGYYFERRRLQVEEILFPQKDPAEMLMKKMRVHELTSVIDALTGGKLSRTLATKKGPDAKKAL